MKIRITSDLHVDINGSTDFGFKNLNDVDLTIIAGDIAGDYKIEENFLKELQGNYVCIGGNHLGYNYVEQTDPIIGTKEDSIQHLRNIDGPIYYLENDYIKFKDKIIFGGTMYSNYKLYENISISKSVGEHWLNDFRYVHTFNEKENCVRPVTADDYINWFNLFKKKLKKCIKETEEDIIVVTHFAPSKKSVSKAYMTIPTYNDPGYYLNASYASNLESLIRNNPRIKLWVHGHMHDNFDYYIKQCHVICHPCGYCFRDNYSSPEEYFGTVIGI